ncbi:MAG TPA: hypothetical protein VLT36_12705 [Candidatus Dormibacteraeota bacterium]|nr:hypothetical protein [Candidatus Dormibacteraeota bacterium]
MHWTAGLRLCGILDVTDPRPVMSIVGLLSMLCEICHKNEATIHLTQKTPGQSDKRRHLCAECFPEGGTDADQIRAIAKRFGIDLPADVEIRDTKRPS